jgi:hypothetical protein
MATALFVASTVRFISFFASNWYFEQGNLLGRALLDHFEGEVGWLR